MTIILEDDPRVRIAHPTITSGWGQGRVTLAPGPARVLAGTPLAATPLGWSPAKSGGLIVAGETAWAGEEITVWRGAVIETNKKQFKPGERIGLKDIDDLGMIFFAPDPQGIYIALSPSVLVVDFANLGVVESSQEPEGKRALPKPD